MVQRVVSVRLSAQIQQYQSEMLKAAAVTRTVGTEAEKLAQKKAAFEQLGRAGMVAGGLIAAGIAVAVKKFADFDAAISNVAATGEDARNSIVALRDAAIEAGARTVFSATEAANAIEELAKAGVDATDILNGGLDGALDLAAAGGLAVADAAGIAAVALKTFNLQGSDMSHVADLLAAGAGKAMGEVSDFSAALAQGGQVAAATGLSIEETTAALAAFASKGLLGSDAGTSLKTMLQRLTPQSKEAAEQFEALGISAYDANGEFVGLSAFAGQLKESMSGLTPEARNAAMAVMFGSDAVRAANVLYDEGWRGIEKWTTAVNDQGYAAETARTKLNNLKGDVEALGGAFDSALIAMGSAADGPLRGLVQGLTAVVDGFNELPAGAKDATLWISAAAAAALTAGGVYLAAVPKIAEYRANLQTLGSSATRTTRIVAASASGLSVALLGASVVIGAFASAQARAKAQTEELADSLDQVTGAATAATNSVVADLLTRKGEGIFGIETDAIQDWGLQLGVSLDQATDAVLGNGDAFEQLSIYYKAAKGDAVALQTVMDQSGLTADIARDRAAQFTKGIDKLRENSRAAREEIERQNKAQEVGGDVALSAADAFREEADATGELEQELADLIRRMNETNDVNGDAISSNARWRESLAGIREDVEEQKKAYEDANGSLEGFKLSLDQNTVAGSANAAMLAEVAGAAQKAAGDQYKVDIATMGAEKAATKYVDTLASQRAEFVKNAEDAGYSKKAVKELADQVFALPDKRSVDILVDPSKALSKLESFIRDASAKTIRIGVVTYRKSGQYGVTGQVDGSEDQFFAAGGPVIGPGTSTSDSIPAMLSTAELDEGGVVPAPHSARKGWSRA